MHKYWEGQQASKRLASKPPEVHNSSHTPLGFLKHRQVSKFSPWLLFTHLVGEEVP